MSASGLAIVLDGNTVGVEVTGGTEWMTNTGCNPGRLGVCFGSEADI
jgi:hypothetical protein